MTVSRFDIEKIRKKMQQKVDGRRMDATEFRPAKAKKDEVVKYRFFVLPDLSKGDKCCGGMASRDMGLFVVKHGQHWINKKPIPCPRIINDEECELCQFGFEALNDVPKSEKAKRSAIIKQWLSMGVFASNIYFPPIDPNPEELRNTVRWYNAPKQVFDIWYAALNRDNAGDPEDPEAYGVFYDPFNAFLFQLTVKQSGEFNEYKSSKFIATGGPTPIATSNKKANEEVIQAILDQRHDLWTKIEMPNPEQIHKVFQSMLYGGDAATDDEIAVTTPEDVENGNDRKKQPSVSSGTMTEVVNRSKTLLDKQVERVAKEVPIKDTQVVQSVATQTTVQPKQEQPKSDVSSDDDNDTDIRDILARLKKGEVED